MIRVLVVDDEALVRAGFTMVLGAQADIEVVGEAADGAAALTQVRALRPDVVVMDVRMPVMDGLAATRAIVAGEDHARVIVLTTFDEDAYIFQALQAGASGFLLKDTPPEGLVDAVRVVAAGEAVLHPAVTRTVVERFASGGANVPLPVDAALGELTQREHEVFGLIALALSNAEIAAALHISETTAKTHVARILMKLGLRDRAQAVVRAYESGVVRPGA